MKFKTLFSMLCALAIIMASCGVKEDIAKLQKKVKYATKDSDGDGVANVHDKDNSTEADTPVYGDGTPADVDMDGVSDTWDKEILSPQFTQVDTAGIANDKDGDGVPDAVDKEKNTKSGALVNFLGQSVSGNTASGSVDSGVLPSAEVAGKFQTVLFRSGVEMDKAAYSALVNVYNFMATNSAAKVRATGHAASSEKNDVELGKQRADKVVAALVSMGIDKGRLETDSKGKSQPANVKVSKLNRRVAFEMVR